MKTYKKIVGTCLLIGCLALAAGGVFTGAAVANYSSRFSSDVSGKTITCGEGNALSVGPDE